MSCSRSPDFHQKSFRINDKFLSRLLSKESHPSFRVYYGDVSSAVPFTWESRPGTPKHPSCSSHSHIPPLTPPPSYRYLNSNNLKTSSSTRRSTNLLFHTLIRRRINPNPNPSSLSWSSSSPSLDAHPNPTPPLGNNKRRRFASWGSYGDHHRHQDFQASKDRGGDRPRARSYSIMIIKKAFLSIIGRASSHPK